MQTEPFPAAKQQDNYGVPVDGNRFDETTGDRLVETTHLPRAYENHEASAVQRTYAGQTAPIAAANKKAVWSGNLSRNLMRKLFVHAPNAPAVNNSS